MGVFEDIEGTQGHPPKPGREGLPGLWTEPWDQQLGLREPGSLGPKEAEAFWEVAQRGWLPLSDG